MKANDYYESQQRINSRPQSTTSSILKLNENVKGKKLGGRIMTSALLQQRLGIQLIDGNMDVTPKPLMHPMFMSIDDRHMTAFETIGFSQAGSSVQLASSITSTLKGSSSVLTRTASFPIDDMHLESFLSTQLSDMSYDFEEKAPLQFYLPRYDSEITRDRPKMVTIRLKETETSIIFEMLPLTSDLDTPEGLMVQEENEKYRYITTGPGSLRKLMNAETQTIQKITKTRGTYLGQRSRRNKGMFVNNWVINDTYAEPELMVKVNGRFIVRTRESFERILEEQELQNKLSKLELSIPEICLDKQLESLGKNTKFTNAARIIDRIISNNVYLTAQKRFKGLIQQDPCSIDLEFTYSLDLLWTHTCELNRDRPVRAFCWNYVNSNVIAVAYGAKTNSKIKDGLLLIWCVKNPGVPGKWYKFESPISDIDWSHDRPNLLAIGFYNGAVKIIDASNADITVIRQSHRATFPARAPHWQVQWWIGDEQFDFQEQLHTSNEDGCVYRYSSGEDFIATEMMKIYRVEAKLPGVDKINRCVAYDIPISRNPGALILRKHPTLSAIYFIGSSEGAVYRCSTNYLYQHIDSFLAHDGPIYSMEFSPFYSKLFLTCGADWCIRIWLEDLYEPLITLSTTMACVQCATWCPTYSTVIASVVNNEICVWDIKRKTYTPTSVTVSKNNATLNIIEFTSNGKQIVVADVEGVVYIYNLEGMPFPPYDQQQLLIESIEKSLVTKPVLLRKFKKGENTSP